MMRAAAAHTEELRDPRLGPVCTVPTEVGRTRTRYRTVPSKNHRYRKVVDFGSMFSEHPNYAVIVEPAAPRPAFVAPEQLRWTQTGKNEQAWLQKECRVTGADYWKYFKRPLIPSSHLLLPNVVFAQEDFGIPEQQPTHFTVGVQTDYRESETQTDPYSPEYVVRRGAAASELLQMAALSWGRGLPAGLDEVEMIEWAREKRAWEARLPPLNDRSQLNKRRRMLEEILAKEWALRDAKIQKLQEARLALLENRLRQRHEAQEDATSERINQIYSEYEEEKEARLQKIHNAHMRALRKLEAKRKTAGGKRERLDIVSEFQTYLLTDRRTNKSGGQKSVTNKGVHVHGELHQSVPKPGIKTRKVVDLNPIRVGKAVDLLMKYKAQTEEEKIQQKKRPRRFPVKKNKFTPPASARGKSPSQSEEEEKTELAVIVLQKLLRGRQTQYEMCKAMEDNRDLMRELRTVHSIDSEEQELLKADEEQVTAMKDQRDQQREKVSEQEAFHSGVVGAEQELLFDTLSKEMVRLQEERRIHAFALLADRERRRREAEESGRRQEEERRRREEDEIFTQVVQVHQQSVDMYLEDIILETLEKMSHEKAREEIYEKLKELNEISYAMEKSRDKRQSEEIVSELLYSHLIPGVEKNIFWQNVRLKQRKHLEAAQSIIQEIVASTGATSSTGGQEDETRRDDQERT
ncbi:hypothetical protein OJAV_G00203600 [Oryzias javanicus]|uniref:Cilia- and flagella-associated protein 91 n=1 Tax=Oryzias javanicus TaxID=123683 RepID=A0A437C5I5_ORYJA|nr:hypothetical protein OJAV_G00203600 [Oryzias javanicus]